MVQIWLIRGLDGANMAVPNLRLIRGEDGADITITITSWPLKGGARAEPT